MQQISIRCRGTRQPCPSVVPPMAEGNDEPKEKTWPPSDLDTVLDSILFRGRLIEHAAAMPRWCFRICSLVSRCTRVLAGVALAKAEARCGVRSRPRPREPRLPRLDRCPRNCDFGCCAARPIMSAIRSCRWCTRWWYNAGEAGQLCRIGRHPPRTSWSTAVVLQLRAGLKIIEDDIAALRDILTELSRRYRDTPMAVAHPSATPAAGDVRLQGRDLAFRCSTVTPNVSRN